MSEYGTLAFEVEERLRFWRLMGPHELYRKHILEEWRTIAQSGSPMAKVYAAAVARIESEGT